MSHYEVDSTSPARTEELLEKIKDQHWCLLDRFDSFYRRHISNKGRPIVLRLGGYNDGDDYWDDEGDFEDDDEYYDDEYYDEECVDYDEDDDDPDDDGEDSQDEYYDDLRFGCLEATDMLYIHKNLENLLSLMLTIFGAVVERGWYVGAKCMTACCFPSLTL
jgi:hypothetical protein